MADKNLKVNMEVSEKQVTQILGCNRIGRPRYPLKEEGQIAKIVFAPRGVH